MLVAIMLVGILAGGTLTFYAIATIPAYDPGKLDADATSKVYDINGELIANLHAEENRTPVPLDQIPVHLQNAVLSMEDARFYDHFGFDLRGLGRAIIRTLTGQRLEGGSTITNQVAKMAFLTPERKLTRKIQEAIITLRLERDYTKPEILEFYLNRLFLGGSVYGVQEAAHYYFGKDVSELNLAESAMLAGIISAPNAYNPYKDMERAKQRQQIALSNMVRFGHISEEERDAALNQEIVLKRSGPTQQDPTPQYFVAYVRSQVISILQEQGYSLQDAQQMVFTGGLTINTTLDMRMQRAAEKALDDGLNQLLIPLLSNKEERNAKNILQPQAAVILLDVKTGGIRAMIGGREFDGDQHNRAVQLIKQQPGSAIKPLTVYGPALERGATAADIIVDEPIYANGEDKPPYPVNYSGTYSGPVTLRYAWQESLNVPAWKVAEENGVQRMIDFAKRLGITTLVETPVNGVSDRNLAALAIGGVSKGVIPLEMAQAFGAIANKGVRNDTFAIVDIRDQDGRLIYESRPQSEVVLSEEVAFMMTDIMEDVIDHGTASSARSRSGYTGPMAGKTGTSNYNREAWFVGYTPELAGAVFIGHDDNTTGNKAGDPNNPDARGRLPGGSSSYISAAIFGRMMNNIKAECGPGASAFYESPPEGIVGPLQIDKTTGKLAGPSCQPNQIIYEYFIKGTEPTLICNDHSVIPEDPEDPTEPEDPTDRQIRKTRQTRQIRRNRAILPKSRKIRATTMTMMTTAGAGVAAAETEWDARS
ncbi:MAG: transglycosylase domain-containing protein [Bacillota bacterium]